MMILRMRMVPITAMDSELYTGPRTAKNIYLILLILQVTLTLTMRYQGHLRLVMVLYL